MATKKYIKHFKEGEYIAYPKVFEKPIEEARAPKSEMPTGLEKIDKNSLTSPDGEVKAAYKLNDLQFVIIKVDRRYNPYELKEVGSSLDTGNLIGNSSTISGVEEQLKTLIKDKGYDGIKKEIEDRASAKKDKKDKEAKYKKDAEDKKNAILNKEKAEQAKANHEVYKREKGTPQMKYDQAIKDIAWLEELKNEGFNIEQPVDSSIEEWIGGDFDPENPIDVNFKNKLIGSLNSKHNFEAIKDEAMNVAGQGTLKYESGFKKSLHAPYIKVFEKKEAKEKKDSLDEPLPGWLSDEEKGEEVTETFKDVKKDK